MDHLLQKHMPLKKSVVIALQDAFLKERDLAYHIPLHPNEADTSCAGKHLRLMAFCKKESIPVRQRIVFFRWEDIAFPKEILALNKEKNPSHLYLEISDGETWHSIDATWDPGLVPLLPINTWNDFREEMRIAVEPTKILSQEESMEYMDSLKDFDVDAHLKKQRPFLEALNQYLNQIRQCV